MTNAEKYPTLESRITAFELWCLSKDCPDCEISKKLKWINKYDDTNQCALCWLELEAESLPKLQPCPFCGCQDIILNEHDGGHIVHCEDCSANVFDRQLKQAVIKWNRRH